MAKKFIRGLAYPIVSDVSGSVSFSMKILYEFWGFCINGTSSLTNPGGMPTTPTNMPVNFTGGTSLLTSGSDGYTAALVSNLFSGDAIFNSATANFTSNMVGQCITIWKENSNSAEDGIYLITQYISPTQVKINLNNGGFPDPTSFHPSFSNRTNINFRVFNPVTASVAANTNGNYIVLQFNPTGINAGQGNSQAQFIIRSTGQNLGLVLSGSGSWNGSAFIDDGYLTTEITAQGNNSSFSAFNSSISINMSGDKDYVIGHLMSRTDNICNFHIEIPQRIYPQENDLHPIIALAGVGSNGSIISTNFTDGRGYGTGISMKTHSSDTLSGSRSTRKHSVLVKATQGDSLPNVFGQNLADFRVGFNTFKGSALSSDGMLCLPSVASQFCLARCRLRNVRFTGTFIPSYHRVGINGNFIQLTNGVCWPWDNTIVPHNLFAQGF